MTREQTARHRDAPSARRRSPRLADAIRLAGVRPVIVDSGRSGHRHLFCRLPNLVSRRYFAHYARVLKLDVRASIRPPGSPHRLSLPVKRGNSVRVLRPSPS